MLSAIFLHRKYHHRYYTQNTFVLLIVNHPVLVYKVAVKCCKHKVTLEGFALKKMSIRAFLLLSLIGGVGGLEAKCLCKRSEFLPA